MILLLTAWLAAASPGATRLQQGQAEFNRGDYAGALRALDEAATETSDPKQLAQIHLLRGQALGAQRDLVGAEKAFEKALLADPEAALNPARVDPTLVNLLEALRERMKGELDVATDPAGAMVTLDGNLLGPAPVHARVGIGRHALAARSNDGKVQATQSILVYARRSTDVQLKLAAAPGQARADCPDKEAPPKPSLKPLADVRLAVDPLSIAGGAPLGDWVAAEVGGGAEWSFLRAQLSLRVYPDFGFIPRVGVAVPIADAFHAYIEGEAPVIIAKPISFGVGASLGAEYSPIPWISPFVQLGARYYFTGYIQERLPIQAGLRLRLP